VKGCAVPLLEARPDNHVSADRLGIGEEWSQTFELVPQATNVRIGTIRTESTFPVETRLEEIGEGTNRRYTVHVALLPTTNSGMFNCSIEIPINEPTNQPPIRLTCSGNIGARLNIVPGALDLFASSAPVVKDVYRYAKSRRPDAMRLQLPKGLKLRIHEVIRNRLRARSLIAGSFGIGVMVTALESVCTGQVYVPTLVLAVRSQQSAGRALAGLLLYNVAFLLPLAGVFVCCYAGVSSQSLVRWSGRHAITAKVIMGIFFLALALILSWFS
jgi:hypothetical protein